MLLPIFLPFFNFLLLAFFGRFIGKTGTVYITIYSLLIATALNIKLFFNVLTSHTTYYILLGSWIQIAAFEVN
jgi:NADH:ubiquinone oxidoreductase subunit 5 (subunit L)/multisubunit Na+/H+ antiporter MnhA subunit